MGVAVVTSSEVGLITQAKTDCHLKPYGYTLERGNTCAWEHKCVCVCVYVCASVVGVLLARCQNVKLIQRPDFGVDF